MSNFRDVFLDKETAPIVATWFEERTYQVWKGEGKKMDKTDTLLCRTFDKGNTITEKIADESDFNAFPKEYALFKGEVPVESKKIRKIFRSK